MTLAPQQIAESLLHEVTQRYAAAHGEYARLTLAESHVVRALRGGQLYRAPESNEFPDEYYVRGPASIRHRNLTSRA